MLIWHFLFRNLDLVHRHRFCQLCQPQADAAADIYCIRPAKSLLSHFAPQYLIRKVANCVSLSPFSHSPFSPLFVVAPPSFLTLSLSPAIRLSACLSYHALHSRKLISSVIVSWRSTAIDCAHTHTHVHTLKLQDLFSSSSNDCPCCECECGVCTLVWWLAVSCRLGGLEAEKWWGSLSVGHQFTFSRVSSDFTLQQQRYHHGGKDCDSK